MLPYFLTLDPVYSTPQVKPRINWWINKMIIEWLSKCA